MAKINFVTEENSQLKSSNGMLQQQISVLNGHLRDARVDARRLKQDLSGAQASRNSSIEDMDVLKKTLGNLSEQVSHLAASEASMKDDLNHDRATMRELRSSNSELEEEVTRLRKQLRELKEAKQELSRLSSIEVRYKESFVQLQREQTCSREKRRSFGREQA